MEDLTEVTKEEKKELKIEKNYFDDFMAIQKEILDENKRLRVLTVWLIVLTMVLTMEPVTSLFT